MPRKKKKTRRTPADQHITVHLGKDGRANLARCQQLLAEPMPPSLVLSCGLVLRIALRRLLLALLGERADWTVPADPIAEEYLTLVEMETYLGEILVQAEGKQTLMQSRSLTPGQPKTPLKGGVE